MEADLKLLFRWQSDKYSEVVLKTSSLIADNEPHVERGRCRPRTSPGGRTWALNRVRKHSPKHHRHPGSWHQHLYSLIWEAGMTELWFQVVKIINKSKIWIASLQLSIYLWNIAKLQIFFPVSASLKDKNVKTFYKWKKTLFYTFWLLFCKCSHFASYLTWYSTA